MRYSIPQSPFFWNIGHIDEILIDSSIDTRLVYRYLFARFRR